MEEQKLVESEIYLTHVVLRGSNSGEIAFFSKKKAEEVNNSPCRHSVSPSVRASLHDFPSITESCGGLSEQQPHSL